MRRFLWACLKRGQHPRLPLIERDPLIYAFWHCLFEHTEKLVDRFLELPISLKTWRALKPLLAIDKPNSKNMLDLAVAGLFFNRANFSGIISGGPIGGMSQKSDYKIDCRTNKSELIARIAKIAELADLVSIKFGDGLAEIKKDSRKTSSLYYVDPPYFLMGDRLYRHHFSHKDHKSLASALAKARFPWILSYDDHHVIEFLYRDCDVKKYRFLYSVKKSKLNSELVIANFKLPRKILGD